MCLRVLGGIQSALPNVPASGVRAISHTPLVILQLAGRRSLLRLREHVGAHYFDANIGLVAFDPSIVPWRDCVKLASGDGLFGAVSHADSKAPGNRIADMGNLAVVGLDDWL